MAVAARTSTRTVAAPKKSTKDLNASKKKTTTKTKAKVAVATKPSGSHPSWKDIIRECIAAHTSEARSGVSRATIKKFAEETYKIEMGGLQTSQLNRAIASGAEHGVFSLPKGPSGKVKLAPKVRTNVLKENNQPPAPKRAPVKEKETVMKAPVKRKAVTKPVATSKKASTAKAAKKQPAAKAASAKASKEKSAKPTRGTASKAKPKKVSA